MRRKVDRRIEPAKPVSGPRSRLDVAHRFRGAVAGLLAAAAGLGVAEALAAVVSGPSPVVAVGTWAIDTSPQSLTEWAIRHFHAEDKKVLVCGVLTTLALLAALAGWIGASSRRAALGMSTTIGVIAVIAGATVRGSHGSQFVRLLPAVAALVVSTASLHRLLGALPDRPGAPPPGLDETEPAGPSADRPPPARLSIREHGEPALDRAPDMERPAVIIPYGHSPPPLERREFVRTAGTVGALALTGAVVRELAGSQHGRGGLVGKLPAAWSPAPGVSGADFNIAGLTPYFTPNAQFYRVDTAIEVPQLNAGGWELRIDGMVENPLTITYDDLVRARLIERDVTLTCVSDEVGGNLISNARWLGLTIRELLAAARPKTGADAVRSHSIDGWTAGTPLSALTDPGRDAMLAIGMNSVPLPAEHGYPVRMVVPGLYGYVSATKWLTRIEVTRFDAFQAYWTQRGWAPQAPIKTESRLDLPKPYQEIAPGPTTIAGIAWAQHRGISKVEVQVDDQPWRTATLTQWHNPDTWRQWQIPWNAPLGTHNLQIRATDSTGAVQTDKNAQTVPDGASGWDQGVTPVVRHPVGG